jgi:hypothetical protein
MISKPWDVGTVRFHPSGAGAELVERVRREDQRDLPTSLRDLADQTAAELRDWAVAEVKVSGGVEEAMPLVDSALTVLRAVQYIEHPMSAHRFQAFGLPGQATAATLKYFDLTKAMPGWTKIGVLGGWPFEDDTHAKWEGEPAYRFLNGALRLAPEQRTPLQHRALMAIELLSQAWLSWQPDIAFLSSVMALEALLGEPGDSSKKFRIARRISYFTCGSPLTSFYAGERRPACPLMALPLSTAGKPGPELDQVLRDMRKTGGGIRCSYFLDVIDLYDARSEMVHTGRLGLTESQESHATWFIAAWLLRPALTWFAGHPTAELTELDGEIASLAKMPWPPAANGGVNGDSEQPSQELTGSP